MHVHLPKPLHGWREFAGEVGVIVLGVLMALGAQKVLQDIQLSGDITAFRGTIDQEIAANLYAYDLRVRQADCVDKHLDQVEAWLARSRSGRTVSLRAGAPASISLYRSAWDNRNAEIFNSLPDKFRAKYAEFYDELPVFHGDPVKRPVSRDPTSIDPIDDAADSLVIDDLVADDFTITDELSEDFIADHPSAASLKGGRPHRGPFAHG